MKWSEHNAYYRPGAILLTLRGILIRVLNKCIIGCFGCCYWGGGGRGTSSSPSEVPSLWSFHPVSPLPTFLFRTAICFVRRLLRIFCSFPNLGFLLFASLIPQKTNLFGVCGVWRGSFQWWRSAVLRTAPTAKWTRATPIQQLRGRSI